MKIVKKHKEFELPTEGSHLAVLADILDLGERPTAYGLKERLRFVWLVDQLGADGKQITVIATYTKSLDDRATLVRIITDITGKVPGEEFETENVIGANARVIIKHNQGKDGRVYANIVAILRPGKGEPVLKIPDWFERGDGGQKVAAAPSPAPKPISPARASPTEERKSPEPAGEPPGTSEWDPSQYDQVACDYASA
jgi:hypothetical protein